MVDVASQAAVRTTILHHSFRLTNGHFRLVNEVVVSTLSKLQLINVSHRHDRVCRPFQANLLLRVEDAFVDGEVRDCNLVLGQVLTRGQSVNIQATGDLGGAEEAVVEVGRPVTGANDLFLINRDNRAVVRHAVFRFGQRCQRLVVAAVDQLVFVKNTGSLGI